MAIEITVDKDDLINLICGTGNPPKEIQEDEVFGKCGYFHPLYNTWYWYRSLLSTKLYEYDLYNLYLKLK